MNWRVSFWCHLYIMHLWWTVDCRFDAVCTACIYDELWIVVLISPVHHASTMNRGVFFWCHLYIMHLRLTEERRFDVSVHHASTMNWGVSFWCHLYIMHLWWTVDCRFDAVCTSCIYDELWIVVLMAVYHTSMINRGLSFWNNSILKLWLKCKRPFVDYYAALEWSFNTLAIMHILLPKL